MCLCITNVIFSCDFFLHYITEQQLSNLAAPYLSVTLHTIGTIAAGLFLPKTLIIIFFAYHGSSDRPMQSNWLRVKYANLSLNS